MPLAASPGFAPFDAWVLILAFAGVATFAAVGALSHQRERAFSASLVYLGLGVLGAVLVQVSGIAWVDPVRDATPMQHLTELAVVVALFSTGLRLDRAIGARPWATVGRLLLVGMPLVIGAVALFGTQVMGLSLGAAVVLGAALAPTDPVLAGDIGVGPPGEEDEAEPSFSITAEAGLNDGLAFPFVLLGLVLAGDTTSIGAWVGWDVLYALPVGIGLGAVAGNLLARALVPLRERDLLLDRLDGFLMVAAVLLVYGAVEALDAYGFMAVFAAGLAFRRHERDHELNRRFHDATELVEKLGELAVILLLGTALTLAGLAAPGLSGWLLVPLLLLVLRPGTVLLSLVGTRLPRRERLFVAWFGVRGIGSLFYVAVAATSGALAKDEVEVVVWTVIAVVVTSITVHGISATPLARRWT